MITENFYGLARPGRREPFLEFPTMTEAVRAKPLFREAVIVKRSGRTWKPVEESNG